MNEQSKQDTKNPLLLLHKAEIAGWDSDPVLGLCMSLGEQLHLIPSSCFPAWEAEPDLILW